MPVLIAGNRMKAKPCFVANSASGGNTTPIKRLAMRTTVTNGADGMNNKLGWQGLADLRVTCLAAAE